MPFTNEQLVERRRYIGGSEAASAVGLSGWFTPYELYLSKIGKGEPIEETLPMMVGTALEPVILRWFEKESGLTLSGFQEVVTDRAIPWRRATLDAKASDGGNVQAKASGVYGWWGKEEDAIPEGVIVQCQHEMACNDATHTWVPVIIGQRKFNIYRIDRSEEMIEHLTAGEAEFMRRVHDFDPPPPTDHADLKLRYPVDTGIELVATAEIQEIALALADTKKKLKAMEVTEDAQAFQIKNFMGDAAVLVDYNRMPLFTYKSNVERRMDVTTFRKDHPALAEHYSPEKTVRKLLCKVK